MPTVSIGRYSSCLGPIRLSDGSHESSVLWKHTPAATVPYLGLGAEISLVGYVLKTSPVGILDVPFSFHRQSCFDSLYRLLFMCNASLYTLYAPGCVRYMSFVQRSPL